MHDAYLNVETKWQCFAQLNHTWLIVPWMFLPKPISVLKIFIYHSYYGLEWGGKSFLIHKMCAMQKWKYKKYSKSTLLVECKLHKNKESEKKGSEHQAKEIRFGVIYFAILLSLLSPIEKIMTKTRFSVICFVPNSIEIPAETQPKTLEFIVLLTSHMTNKLGSKSSS